MAKEFVVGLLIALATQQTGQIDRAAAYAKLDHAALFAALGRPVDDERLGPSLALLTPDVRAEFERRLARRDSYSKQIGPPVTGLPFPGDVIAAARSSIRTAIVALLEAPTLTSGEQASLEREAAAFARTTKLYYEWEGYADGPFNEAASADAYQQAHPTTVLRPFLDLYLLHRYRCAFEAATWEIGQYSWPRPTPEQREASDNMNRDYQKRAAAQYVEAWQRLSNTTDPVVRAVADEIDGVRLVYIAVGEHPRTFVPR